MFSSCYLGRISHEYSQHIYCRTIFPPHPSNTEFCVWMTSARRDQIIFTHEGGIDVSIWPASSIRYVLLPLNISVLFLLSACYYTAQSICGLKWAIARDLSVYDANTTKNGVCADRSPWVCEHSRFPLNTIIRFSCALPFVVGLSTVRS